MQNQPLPKMPPAWFLAGPLLMVGAAWIAIYVITTSMESMHLEVVNHALGGLIGGLVLGRAVTVPLRRLLPFSVYCGLAGIGIFTLLFLVQLAWFSWAPARSEHPWLMAGALGAVTAATAAGGGWLGSRWARGEAPSAPTWLLVSGLVTMGILVVVLHSISVDAWWAAIGPIAAGGALTQLVIPTRRIWVSGSGALVFSLFALDRYRQGEATLGQTATVVISLVVFVVPIAALGARLAWRLSGRTKAASQPELPAARLQ